MDTTWQVGDLAMVSSRVEDAASSGAETDKEENNEEDSELAKEEGGSTCL
jgi:hypothetical protein